MKINALISAALLTLTLTSCSAWIHGNKPLADTDTSDQQLNAKLVDGTSTLADAEKLFGEKVTGRSVITKSFPDGKYAQAQFTGHLNGLTGTYAHRSMYVAYDANGVIVNHAITTNNFRETNKFESDTINAKNNAFASLNQGDPQSKVISVLGQPRFAGFADNGNLLWIYSNTAISRDASSYIPFYTLAAGTESGQSERLYIEFNRQNTLENLYAVDFTISQGRGIANAGDYEEKVDRVVKKF